MKTEKKILDNGKYNTSEDKASFHGSWQFPKYLSSHTNSSFFLDTLSNEVKLEYITNFLQWSKGYWE